MPCPRTLSIPTPRKAAKTDTDDAAAANAARSRAENKATSRHTTTRLSLPAAMPRRSPCMLTPEQALADLGITPPQFAVLTVLRAYPGLSGADLARVALLTPQTVGVIIGNLERDGAIRKTPHPVHGRG